MTFAITLRQSDEEQRVNQIIPVTSLSSVAEGAGRRISVLLIISDLYKEVGGGQTVYRKVIADTPEVDFHYFCEDEPLTASRPVNASPIPLVLPRRRLTSNSLLEPHYEVNAARDADFYARNVAGRHFDIVEFPDFITFGAALPTALRRAGVTWTSLVLSMHGNISTSIRLNWGSQGDNGLEQAHLERKQFAAADFRYALSETYAQEWLKEVAGKVHIIDPFAFSDPATTPLRPPIQGRGQPQLLFVGRMERLKGPDIFIESLSWLDSTIYSRAELYGHDVVGHDGQSGRQTLLKMISTRGLTNKVGLNGPLPPAKLRAIYDSRSILVVPSRADTFNLVALEAVFRGTPIIVPRHIGVTNYLQRAFPSLPVFTFEIDDPSTLTAAIDHVCRNYDQIRSELAARLNDLGLDRRERAAPMASFYAAAASGEPARRSMAEEDPYRILVDYRHLIRHYIPAPLRAAAKGVADSIRPRAIRAFIRRRLAPPASIQYFVARAAIALRAIRSASRMPESTKGEVISKLKVLQGPSANAVFRQTLWRELARLEAMRGRHDMAATYGLRVLRASAEPDRVLAEQTVRSLSRAGLDTEAEATRALFLDSDPEAVVRFLEARERELKALPVPTDYEIRIDQREAGHHYKVSVIVSMFKAANKLEHFLKLLFRQTAFQRGEVEVILVDSGSPDREVEVFKGHFLGQPHLLFVRSPQRETIQAAWNRGISLAQGDYLAFLGVDETLYPDALDILSSVLDSDPAVDWAMADSLLINVDISGAYVNDVMVYSRAEGTRDLTFLETAYVSWVGGLYRRDIHDRFGMYDPSFRAAGDTEFKNRVLKNLKVEFVPEVLGLFINYPEERTTQSPRAELEDMRAWYLHRSDRGVRYLMSERSDEEVFNLFKACLNYRKSFRTDASTDFSMAESLVHELDRRGYRPDLIGQLKDDFRLARENFQRLEVLPKVSKGHYAALAREALSVRQFFNQLEERHRRLFPDIPDLRYTIVGDNRYEQHFWAWESS